MNDMEVGVGQWSEPGRSGDATTASAYAGFGDPHLVVVADGARGATPAKSAAQAAVAAVTSAFRTGSPHMSVADRLGQAFRSVHAAIQEATVGTQAEGRAGAELAAFVIEPGQVTFARVGGGRLYVLESHGTVSFPVTASSGFAGDGSAEPDIVTRALTLMPGDRLVLATEATARTIAADIGALAHSSSPQLTAQALVSAARRRGERGALVAHVVEVRSEMSHRTRRPALSTLDVPMPPAIGLDGRQVRGMPRSTSGRDIPWGWLVALVCLAAVTIYWPAEFWMGPVVAEPPDTSKRTEALAATPRADAERRAPVVPKAPVGVTKTTSTTPRPNALEVELAPGDDDRAEIEAAPEVKAEPEGDTTPNVQAEARRDGTIDPNEPLDPKVADIFKWENPRIAARELKRYLVRANQNRQLRRAQGMVERWISDHPDRQTFLILVNFREKKLSTRLRRWARSQMIGLYDAR